MTLVVLNIYLLHNKFFLLQSTLSAIPHLLSILPTTKSEHCIPSVWWWWWSVQDKSNVRGVGKMLHYIWKLICTRLSLHKKILQTQSHTTQLHIWQSTFLIFLKFWPSDLTTLALVPVGNFHYVFIKLLTSHSYQSKYKVIRKTATEHFSSFLCNIQNIKINKHSWSN